MITREQLGAWGPAWHLNPPATLEQVNTAQAALGVRFPQEYAEFLLAADGMVFLWEQLPALGREEYSLLRCQEMIEHNGEFDVIHRAPGRLIIGRMGIEGPIFLHLAQGTKRRAPVYQQQDEDFGDHVPFYRRKAKSLTDWLKAGCPLPEPGEEDETESGA